ncbi:Methyltransferase type 12 [Oscillatoria nigro-viridis PCC 7112]|uniref:Methyltransferase type 12 n=1 Tax=Phormidium nigroviride PCC 7112 TaxID=179408 RepID=K9VHS5_9CYAN|nr:SAM-dependent methyltransferase [Oscillatoria nigro-viridis]AFZ07648.1 Methyltransferase type 12 [Oscillatoria nigro-viridis PCC 7112]
MKPSEQESVPSSFFDETYRGSPDPWRYTSSFYETSKFRTTIRALPKVQFKNGFEIGCAIGVLTQKLAKKCDRLLSVDYSEVGLEEARKRCSNLPQVRFEQMEIPRQFPTEKFDLILFSEVGYYFTVEDLQKTKEKIIDQLLPGGYLLMVHFRIPVESFILNGDIVHDAFIQDSTQSLKHLGDPRKKMVMVDLVGHHKRYRMDLFQRL